MGHGVVLILIGLAVALGSACGPASIMKDGGARGAGGTGVIVDGGAAGSEGGHAGGAAGNQGGHAGGVEEGRDGATDGPLDDAADASEAACPPSDYQGTFTPVGCRPLPSGPCLSQDDCGGAAYASVIGCRPFACGSPQGKCTLRESMLCPIFSVQNCGCDGLTFHNECDLVDALVAVQYPGPCRSGAISACDATHPCSGGQECAEDPRVSCSPGTDCPGVCLTAATYPCGQGGLGASYCMDGYCVAGHQSSTCSGSACGFCTFGGASCDDASCPAGQLCVPSIGCNAADAGTCGRFCVIP